MKSPPEGVITVSKALCWMQLGFAVFKAFTALHVAIDLLRFDVKPKKVTAEDGRTKAKFSPAVMDVMARTRLNPKDLHMASIWHILPMNLPMNLG